MNKKTFCFLKLLCFLPFFVVLQETTTLNQIRRAPPSIQACQIARKGSKLLLGESLCQTFFAEAQISDVGPGMLICTH